MTKAPDFSVVRMLAVVRDADGDAAGAFQSVQDALEAAGLPPPTKMGFPGGSHPAIAIYITPDCGSPGRLEHLCLASVAPDPAMACVDAYFACLEGLHAQPNDLEKAKVQAFLASRPRPGLRLGEAAEAGYWPWDSAAFQPVMDFLSSLRRTP